MASVWWLASWERVSEEPPPDLAPPQLPFGSHPVFLPSPSPSPSLGLVSSINQGVRAGLSEGLSAPTKVNDSGPVRFWEMQPPEKRHQRPSPPEHSEGMAPASRADRLIFPGRPSPCWPHPLGPLSWRAVLCWFPRGSGASARTGRAWAGPTQPVCLPLAEETLTLVGLRAAALTLAWLWLGGQS